MNIEHEENVLRDDLNNWDTRLHLIYTHNINIFMPVYMYIQKNNKLDLFL